MRTPLVLHASLARLVAVLLVVRVTAYFPRGQTPRTCTKVARFGLPLAILRVLVVSTRGSTAFPKN